MVMEEVRREMFQIEGGAIPITLIKDNDDDGIFFSINIDGVEWLYTENKTHAVVMFEMMKDHITDYMNYKKI